MYNNNRVCVPEKFKNKKANLVWKSNIFDKSERNFVRLYANNNTFKYACTKFITKINLDRERILAGIGRYMLVQ